MMKLSARLYKTALAAIVASLVLGGCKSPVYGAESGEATRPVSRETPVGQVIIYDKQQDNGEFKENCRFNFKTERVDFQDGDHNCTNDNAYFFKLENVPSASHVSFFDDPDCDVDEGNFDFNVKTIRNPTTMQHPYSLKTAHGQEVGTILDPGGVRLFSKHGDEQVEGKLSCVRMELSPTPENP
ncbi:hypothetical protein [Pseudomonas ovata]|uniref:hypothetical protein n=1 Tax=Pseudomonas ovata TaxID=1839709 RepID=UPI000D699F0D|nr:hypothetical protein [Pseudomonas ovata]